MAQRNLDSIDAYDPRNQRWMNVKPMHSPRRSLGAVALGHSLYAVGGWNGEVAFSFMIRSPVGWAVE